MLANTTIFNITNEIQGAPDSEDDSDLDYIRRISVSNVKVEFVKASNERENKLYKNSLIVVSKNETSGAGANQLTVTRYWQNVFTNWIESEHLFDLQGGPYDDIFVFDHYAIVLKNKNLINAVYFEKFRGNVVPFNFEMPLYDDLEFSSDLFEKITFWDYTGKGNWRMFGAIKTQGSVTIYKFDQDINYENGQGVISRQTKGNSLLASTKITAFEATQDVLILGCPTCFTYGAVIIYEAQTMKQLKAYPGSSGYQYFGNQILPLTNTGGAQQFWVSSRKNSNAHFNSITVSKNYENDQWGTDIEYDLFGF